MKSILCFLFVVSSNLALAEINDGPSPTPPHTVTPSKVEKVKTTPLQSIMHNFLEHLAALKPYLSSDEKFSDPKNNATIGLHLQQLAQESKTASHEAMLEAPGYKPSRQVLEDHVRETERVFRAGNKSYARWMLNSTLSVCMSCHTQLPATSKHLLTLKSASQISSTFEQAEFLFAIRDFDGASKLYEDIINNYPTNKFKPEKLDVALERNIAYFARIKQNPDLAFKSLQQNLKNKALPVYMRSNLEAWIALFKEWAKNPNVNVKTATPVQLREFVKKSMKPELWDKMVQASQPRTVTYLRVSGVLYEYLQLHPENEITPEVLYWLAVCERRLNNSFFYSLADLYLKECITRFPKNPIAKDCYKEFEDNTEVSYSGSGGTNIPPDVQQELDTLKKLIEPAEKKQD